MNLRAGGTAWRYPLHKAKMVFYFGGSGDNLNSQVPTQCTSSPNVGGREQGRGRFARLASTKFCAHNQVVAKKAFRSVFFAGNVLYNVHATLSQGSLRGSRSFSFFCLSLSLSVSSLFLFSVPLSPLCFSSLFLFSVYSLSPQYIAAILIITFVGRSSGGLAALLKLIFLVSALTRSEID